MKSLLTFVCAALLLAACDSRVPTPTGPDSIAAPAPVYTLFGVVTTRGVPVSGARVAVLNIDAALGVEAASATTDGNGYYSMSVSGVRPSSRFGEMVFASKTGYFKEFKYTNPSRDAQVDFALEPWVHVPLDAVIRGRVGDTRCEGTGGSGFCARSAFTPPTSGRLELTAPTFPFDLEVVGPNGLLVGAFYADPGSSPPLQLWIAVDGGVTYEIAVFSAGTVRDFELTTALH